MKKLWQTLRRIKLRKLLLRLFILFFIFSFGAVLIYRFLPVFITPLMVIRSMQSITEPKFIGISKDWVPIEDMSPAMQKAVLKAEDYRFFEHNGFDFEAIEKAIKYNKTHKRKKGASTISQQTAKNVFLWPHRDWIRKGLEAYFTVLIEFVWPKERILEVYLNVIELGPGVYGVEAAANKYFKKTAKNISPAQASLIAAVLPNPRRFKIDRPSNYVISRQQRILNRIAPQIPQEDKSIISDFFDLKFDSDNEEDRDD